MEQSAAERLLAAATSKSLPRALLERIRSTTIQPISLQRSLMAQQHRPILYQLPAKIRFATGTGQNAYIVHPTLISDGNIQNLFETASASMPANKTSFAMRNWP